MNETFDRSLLSKQNDQSLPLPHCFIIQVEASEANSASPPSVAIAHAEPITVFHFEVLTVNDTQVRRRMKRVMFKPY